MTGVQTCALPISADSLGLFINTLPLLVDLKGSVAEYIVAVKKGLDELLSYEQLLKKYLNKF